MNELITFEGRFFAKSKTYLNHEDAEKARKSLTDSGYSTLLMTHGDSTQRNLVYSVFLELEFKQTPPGGDTILGRAKRSDPSHGDVSEPDTTYRVVWEIDIDAQTPQAAALKAWTIQQTRGSLANEFDVFDPDGKKTIVDFEAMGYLTPDEAEFGLIREGRHGL